MNRRIFAGIVLFALLCAMLTGCGGREKVDLNGAASLADLRGATLGAQTGTFHLQALEQVEGVTKKDYADFTDLLNALRSGAIDGYVAEEPTALEVCGKDDTLTYLPFRNNENGFTATDEETGIAAAFRTGSDMTAQVNAILADIPQQTRPELMAQIVAMSADPDTERSEAPVLDASGSTENGVFRIERLSLPPSKYQFCRLPRQREAFFYSSAALAFFIYRYTLACEQPSFSTVNCTAPRSSNMPCS